ncbi:MAG: signal peptidase I [Parcubacteria group bacterium]|jgi:signal peptidase I
MAEENSKKSNVFNGKKESYFGVGSFLLEIVKVFILALVIITPIRVFLFQPFFVQGASMEPNFKDGQYLIINELGYKETDIGMGEKQFFSVSSFKELKRGDVVVFKYPKDPKQYFIKRVIGLPGEKIKVSDGKVYIFNKENPEGFILDESGYLPQELKTQGDSTEQLSDNEYFAMGDNRGYSHDSRAFGPVGKEFIVGKVLVRAWPFNNVAIY